MGQQSLNEFDLRLELLGSEKEPFARVALLVDGIRVDRGYSIDFTRLLKACMAPGQHYVFTCSCGDPGCAGFDDGVEVQIRGLALYWSIRFPEATDLFHSEEGQLKRLVKPTVWVFDQRQVLEEIRQELVYADVTHPWKTEYCAGGVHRRHLAGIVEKIDRRLAQLGKAKWISAPIPGNWELLPM
jgi:hypothetical protein